MEDTTVTTAVVTHIQDTSKIIEIAPDPEILTTAILAEDFEMTGDPYPGGDGVEVMVETEGEVEAEVAGTSSSAPTLCVSRQTITR